MFLDCSSLGSYSIEWSDDEIIEISLMNKPLFGFFNESLKRICL